MNWNEKLQIILDDVENHLQRTQEPLAPQRIVEIAGCSFDFFQKVFSYMNGISFAEYIRNRKLTLAGYDLKSSNIKILDLSYKFGYDSPTSFTKAFQQFHGVTPKAARQSDVQLKVYSKMKVSANNEYCWRIEYKPSFKLIGKSISVSCSDNQHYLKIPQFWNDCQRDGTFAKLISYDDGHPQGLFGLFGYYDELSKQIDYSVMVNSNQDIGKLDDNLIEIIIPDTTWAVFDCYGPVPQAIQAGWRFLNEEWLIKYPFKHASCPELEWYSSGNVYSNDYLSQIWIPIIEEE